MRDIYREGLDILTNIILPYLPELIYFNSSNHSVRQEDQFMTKPKEINSTRNNRSTPHGALISKKQTADYRLKWIDFILVLAIICCIVYYTILCVTERRLLKKELMIEVGQHNFICTHTGHTYWDEKNEVLIQIPRKAIPRGVSLDIDVNVSLYGPFQYPEGLQPISPVVWMCARGHEGFQFLKPVSISLPHYLNIDRTEDCESLGITLLKSDHKRNERNKYLLTPTDMNLEVDPERKRNLKFKTNHFCHLCLAKNVSRGDVFDAQSRAQCFCTGVKDPKTLYFYFYISYYLPTCIELIKEKFVNMDVGDPMQFKFLCKEDQAATLYLSPDIQEEKGWKIVAEHPHKTVSVKDLEFWEKDAEEMEHMERLGLYPPRFVVLVDGSRATENCFLKITFLGDISPNCLDINLHLIKPVKHHAPLLTDTPSPPQHSSNLLDIYDLQEVLLALVDVNKKWMLLALALGLKEPTLAKIEKECGSSIDDCKMNMLREWLNRNDGCRPSWTTLVEALREQTVQHPLIADAIEKKF